LKELEGNVMESLGVLGLENCLDDLKRLPIEDASYFKLRRLSLCTFHTFTRKRQANRALNPPIVSGKNIRWTQIVVHVLVDTLDLKARQVLQFEVAGQENIVNKTVQVLNILGS
jgi:hypothetical protein